MDYINEAEKIKQNLIDAGCDSLIISDFFEINGTDKGRKQMTLLQKHRKRLLEEFHTIQKEIDCLDYLIYQIERQAD